MDKPLDDLFTKTGGVPPVAGFFRGTVLPAVGAVSGLKAMTKSPTPADTSMERNVLSDIIDPSHEAELSKIRIQAMLSDFMSSDPVISTYEPDEVLNIYNQVSQMTPRAAQQPGVMRGLLRKMLQQQDAMEPFEAEQMIGVEKGLKSVAEPEQPPIAPVVGLESTGGKKDE